MIVKEGFISTEPAGHISAVVGTGSRGIQHTDEHKYAPHPLHYVSTYIISNIYIYAIYFHFNIYIFFKLPNVALFCYDKENILIKMFTLS